jgi:hypothetical protein
LRRAGKIQEPAECHLDTTSDRRAKGALERAGVRRHVPGDGGDDLGDQDGSAGRSRCPMSAGSYDQGASDTEVFILAV